MCCGYSLESPHRGDSNEYPQLMTGEVILMSTHNIWLTVLWRTAKNYPSIIIKYTPYLFFW